MKDCGGCASVRQITSASELGAIRFRNQTWPSASQGTAPSQAIGRIEPSALKTKLRQISKSCTTDVARLESHDESSFIQFLRSTCEQSQRPTVLESMASWGGFRPKRLNRDRNERPLGQRREGFLFD